MTFTRSSILAAATALILSTNSPAEAGSYQHIDALAEQLRQETRALRSEFRLHMRHAAHYEHLSNDAYAMYRLASHIHEVAHHHGSLNHLARDLSKLDRLYHHLEELLAHTLQDAKHHHGHIDGDFGHVAVSMNRIGSTLHHLRDDIREMRTVRRTVTRYHGHGGHYGGTSYYGGGPSISYHSKKGGVSYRNGRLGFHFSF